MSITNKNGHAVTNMAGSFHNRDVGVANIQFRPGGGMTDSQRHANSKVTNKPLRGSNGKGAYGDPFMQKPRPTGPGTGRSGLNAAQQGWAAGSSPTGAGQL